MKRGKSYYGGKGYYIVRFPPGEKLLYSQFSGGKGYYGGKATIQHRNNTSGALRVISLTPTDGHKSICNRSVIEVFGGVFYVVKLLFGLFCGWRGFCHWTESDLFLFLLLKYIPLALLKHSGENRSRFTKAQIYSKGFTYDTQVHDNSPFWASCSWFLCKFGWVII